MCSFKFAFVVFLAFTVAVVIPITVQIVEAKPILQEEKSLPLLDLQVSKPVNPQMFGSCEEPCKLICIRGCHCVCPEPPTL
ncbi:hypothetical protein Bca52824_094887 [Brassica carinata]|uniref:Transmembrane protein n=1 Tax=Brassica carinata TaxID=52824 RepID=A0A8X7P2W9_BRACI|nr:hypothetical protein Bca52824_094887 [Brassica carinata]